MALQETGMPTIFVDVDNTDPNHKLFIGTKAGNLAKEAEAKIQEVTQRIVDKASDFTTKKPTDPKALKDLKGYFLMMSVAKVETDTKSAKCTLVGFIVQYPRLADDKGKLGDLLVTVQMTASGSVQGMRNPVIACIEAITEDLVTKSLPVMRKHFATRP
jgi:hypothetical protein